MAERLTRNNKVNFYFHDEASNMVYYKLQDLEDIMEKHSIKNTRQLDARLSGEDKSHKSAIAWQNKYDEMEQDRDTWEKACELACFFACVEVSCDNCPVYEKCKWCGDCIHNLFDYFYQQAKTEGNDERN